MYDIIPPSAYNNRPISARPQKGKWSHAPGGKHFDIIAKNQRRQQASVPQQKVPKPKPFEIRERDISYTFSRTKPESVHARVPSHTPISLPHRSSRIPGLLILLLGFACASFAVWNLQAAGTVTHSISSVQDKIAKAIGYITQAGSAIAETNSDAGQKSFALAGQEFMSAKQDIDAALATSHYILEITDVTGTIRSSKKILDAGKNLAAAGEHIALAVKPFQTVDEHASLTNAIRAGHNELIKTQKYIDAAAENLSGVSTLLLPESAASQVQELQRVLPGIREAIAHLNAESATLLTLLGAERDRQYLVLFANSDELRPVGGFIGSTALVNISRGIVENIDVRSVYDGDGQLKTAIVPPAPLAAIVDRWYLRDSNWFVDYKVSAQKAASLFEKEGGPTVDGVLMLTPQVIKNLLAVTGPIHVPGYDTDVSAENFVTVTQGQVTYNYDRAVNKPKQFLADLAPILLSKLFAGDSVGTQVDNKLALLEAVVKSLSEKDILLYFSNDAAQKDAEGLGWAGAIPQNKQGFLMVDNANIGGHKSDQFIQQEVDYRTSINESGDADVVVTIRRTHAGPQEKINYPYPVGEDPSKKDNIVFQRILVPKDAVLLDETGFTKYADIIKQKASSNKTAMQQDPDIAAWEKHQQVRPDGTIIGKESGYSYFANWVVTRPGQTSVVLYHYTIPRAVVMPSFLKSASQYSIAFVKQPGQRRSTLRASLSLPMSVKIVHSVPETGITLEGDSSVVYRGEIVRDIGIGAVFQK